MLLRNIHISRLLKLFPLLLLVLGSMAFTGYTEQQSNCQSELIFCKNKASKNTTSYFPSSKLNKAGSAAIHMLCLTVLQQQHDRLTTIRFKNSKFLYLNCSLYNGCIQLKTIPSDSPEHPVI